MGITTIFKKTLVLYVFSDFVEIVFSKSVKIQWFFIDFSEIQEIRDFKKPNKT